MYPLPFPTPRKRNKKPIGEPCLYRSYYPFCSWSLLLACHISQKRNYEQYQAKQSSDLVKGGVNG